MAAHEPMILPLITALMKVSRSSRFEVLERLLQGRQIVVIVDFSFALAGGFLQAEDFRRIGLFGAKVKGLVNVFGARPSPCVFVPNPRDWTTPSTMASAARRNPAHTHPPESRYPRRRCCSTRGRRRRYPRNAHCDHTRFRHLIVDVADDVFALFINGAVTEKCPRVSGCRC